MADVVLLLSLPWVCSQTPPNLNFTIRSDEIASALWKHENRNRKSPNLTIFFIFAYAIVLASQVFDIFTMVIYGFLVLLLLCHRDKKKIIAGGTFTLCVYMQDPRNMHKIFSIWTNLLLMRVKLFDRKFSASNFYDKLPTFPIYLGGRNDRVCRTKKIS